MMGCSIYIVHRGHYCYVSMGLEFGWVCYGCFLRLVRKEKFDGRASGRAQGIWGSSFYFVFI